MSIQFTATDITFPISSARRKVAPYRAGVHLGGLSKRTIDVLIAFAAMLVLSPVLLIVSLLIKYSMGGSIIFGHRRVGKDGQPFRCYKFRTMVRSSEEVLAAHLLENSEAAREWMATRKLRNDPRVTRLGRFLRVTSIDELPQLINILLGDMSCVGPRPIVFDELERYGSGASDYFLVRPGLTGLWQISGRSNVTYAERVALDVSYVRNWSLRLDFTIMLNTIPSLAKFHHTC